jgi:hypothetical protein
LNKSSDGPDGGDFRVRPASFTIIVDGLRRISRVAMDFGECPALITDAVVQRLISGLETEEIVVYDVSDCQLYGEKHYRKLTGQWAQAAEQAGCEAEVYQSIYWWTLAYIPIWPKGTFQVIRLRVCDDPDGDADKYRAIRVPMDRWQAATHRLIGFTLVLVTIAFFGWASISSLLVNR